MTSDSFWLEQPEILLNKNRLVEFFPTNEQTKAEKLNSIVRLALYISIILMAYHKSPNYAMLFFIVLAMTYVIYKGDDDVKSPNKPADNTIETYASPNPDTCSPPTLDNPFMNFTMKDRMNYDAETGRLVEKPPPCDISDPDVKKQADDMFNNNLYRDINDIFGKFNSQRQFFTMPYTYIPDPDGEFKNWLYKNPKTCKEDQEACLRYEDVRAKRPVFVNENENPS